MLFNDFPNTVVHCKSYERLSKTNLFKGTREYTFALRALKLRQLLQNHPSPLTPPPSVHRPIVSKCTLKIGEGRELEVRSESLKCDWR